MMLFLCASLAGAQNAPDKMVRRAQTPEARLEVALGEANRLLAAGDASGALVLLDNTAADLKGAPLRGSEWSRLVAAQVEAKEAQAFFAGTLSVPELRARLLSKLSVHRPRSPEPGQVKPVLARLVELDPKAKTFFNRRALTVTVTGLEGSRAEELGGSVVRALRLLEFDAHYAPRAAAGDEVFALEASASEPLPVDTSGALGASFLALFVSCSVKVEARGLGLQVNLSRPATSPKELPERCVPSAIGSVEGVTAHAIVKAWDAR